MCLGSAANAAWTHEKRVSFDWSIEHRHVQAYPCRHLKSLYTYISMCVHLVMYSFNKSRLEGDDQDETFPHPHSLYTYLTMYDSNQVELSGVRCNVYTHYYRIRYPRVTSPDNHFHKDFIVSANQRKRKKILSSFFVLISLKNREKSFQRWKLPPICQNTIFFSSWQNHIVFPCCVFRAWKIDQGPKKRLSGVKNLPAREGELRNELKRIEKRRKFFSSVYVYVLAALFAHVLLVRSRSTRFLRTSMWANNAHFVRHRESHIYLFLYFYTYIFAVAIRDEQARGKTCMALHSPRRIIPYTFPCGSPFRRFVPPSNVTIHIYPWAIPY